MTVAYVTHAISASYTLLPSGVNSPLRAQGQQRIQKAEDKAMADGKMTKKERARLEHMQDQQSRAIHRERHDKQVVKK